MAINVKSPNQIIAEMIRKFSLETSVTDVSEGSTAGTILEAAGLQDYQNQVAALKILESTNLQNLVGTDLDAKAEEVLLPDGRGGIGRRPAIRSSGKVVISSGFEKLSSAIYIGKPAPFAGSVKLYLQDASGWPSTGSIYIGRGTNSEEGPIPYNNITDNVSFFTIDLDNSTPLVNDHLYSESVILAQGGDRSVAAGSTVRAPAAPGNPPVSFTINSTQTIRDGEASATFSVTAASTGEDGNVAANSITVFDNVPFTGATVTNPLALSDGKSAEGDEALRQRIKDYIATLSRGTRTAIASALNGLNDPVSGKTITSVNIVEPTGAGENAKAYIGDGSSFEPSEEGQGFEELLVNSSGKEVLFRTAEYPITFCTANGTKSAPFTLDDGQFLDVEIDGVIERFTINRVEYSNLLSVGASEIVRSFNGQETFSGVQNIGFRTSNGGRNFTVFDLTGRAEKLRVLPSQLQVILGLSTAEIRPIFLYQNNNLLSFRGTTAKVQTADFPWPSLSSSDLQNVGIVVDGVTQYFSINNSDFATFGSSITSASLADWVAVFKKKVAGVNVFQGGGRLFFATWQTLSEDGSVEILSDDQSGNPAGWVGVNKMWDQDLPLSSVGSGVDFELNRLTGQIRLAENPPVDSNLTAASENTRAEILSATAPTGTFAIGPSDFGNAKIVVAADGDFAIRPITVTGSLSLTPTIVSSDQNLVRLMASDVSLFASVKLNDFIYLSPNSSVSNFMTGRLNSFYRVRKKGLNTRSVDAQLLNSTLEFASGSGSTTEVTISTSNPHKVVIGKEVELSNVSLDPANASLNTALTGVHTVTDVVSDTKFKVEITYTGSLSSGPNTATVELEKDSYVEIEVSDLQRDAFFGLFTEAPIDYSLLSSVINVQIPDHGLTGGFVNINSVSPAVATLFPALTGIPGAKPITSIVDANTIQVDLGSSATGPETAGEYFVSGEYTNIFSSYDIVEGMVAAFKCEKTIPQIVDFGSLPNQTVDQINETINNSVIGLNAYKLSPRQLALRSLSYDENTTQVAVLAITGSANVLFDAKTSSGIQQHVASKNSQTIASGGPKFLNVQDPTTPASFYPNLGFLNFDTTVTLIKNNFEKADAEAGPGVSAYPIGLQEIGISGREYNHFKRVYNNNSSAPFQGFINNQNTISSVAQSVNGANIDDSSVGLRMADIPFNFTDNLVIELDLDATNKTTSVPMFKKALTEQIQVFGTGKGSQLTFTLKDPNDVITGSGQPRPFFETNSPYRDFDLTDFNILFKPTLIHTNYPSLPFVGNPSDAFVVRSSQYGANHEIRFSLNLPTAPNTSTIVVSHKSFEEADRVVEAVSVGLKTQSVIIGSEFAGIYTITPDVLTSPTGAEIVKLSISALSINLSGVYQVGKILKIGSTLPFSGAFLIIDTPDPDTVIVAAPGVRTGSLPGPSEVYDGTIAPINSYALDVTTMQEIKDAVDSYFTNNPVITVELTSSTNPAAPILFPTYYTHGRGIPNTNLGTMQASFDYHAKRTYFGSMAHIHTYSPVDGVIVATVQNEEAPLPVNADVINTGFPTNYVDQECMLIPANAKAVTSWINFSAISPFSIQGDAVRVQNETELQLSSRNIGTAGAVRVSGVSANTASAVALSSPFVTGSSMRVNSDFASVQALPRDTLVRVENTLVAPIYRAYRSTPSDKPETSALTSVNTKRTTDWFRANTEVFYSRPNPGIGRFEFRKSLSGLAGGETVVITKVSPFIAKLEITAGSGEFATRTGDMLILRGDFSSSDVSYTSIFNTANQCKSATQDIEDQYIGYPVVHVESETVIYVIGPNITNETVTARDTGFSGTITASNDGFGQLRLNNVTNAGDFSVGDVVDVTGSSVSSYNSRHRVVNVDASNDFIVVNAPFTTSDTASMSLSRDTTEFIFIPMLKSEKNIRTTYASGAPKVANWKVTPNEEFLYRVKDIGNGFAYLDISFSSHQDMQLTGMAVSTDDWIELSDAFNVANRGRFKIVAHNGSNAVIFKNTSVVDEVISTSETIKDGEIGNSLWKIGPKGDADISTTDKRPLRIWDGDSVFEQDKLSIQNPAALTTNWFDSSLIGDWPITEIGLTRDFDLYCQAAINNATSTSKKVLLGSSAPSVSFTEGSPYVGYKWSLGYANSDVDQTRGELFMAPQVLSYKISPAYSTNMFSEHKLQFSDETSIGVDGYRYFTGLIGEAQRVLDGVPSNTAEFPGVRAAGTSIEPLAPLIKSITLSLRLESRDGVSLNSLKNPVKSTISNYVNNALGIGDGVVLSEVTKRIQNVPGVRSVVIVAASPTPDDGVIKVGSFEKPQITRAEDILI